MIRLTVRCASSHDFEGWFRSNQSFDEDVEAGRLTCPFCGSTKVARGIMAPAVVTRKGADPVQPGASAQPANAAIEPSGGTGEGVPAVVNEKTRRAVAMYRAMAAVRAHVERHFDHVGDRFADEARKIHYEEAEARPIFGNASLDDVRELDAEGIEVGLLPDLPREDG